MNDPITCLKCGAPLQGGECPRCLMAAGLESGVPGAPPSSAPSPADMQKHFPGLEILELLGQGGMGIVYKARQKNLDRFVALKVLLPEIAREHGFAERFTREARTLGRLQHPRIVGVHDFGESDGLWFLVMEYVDGTNLRQVMRSGGLGAKEALAIVPQVCDALQYAHDQGIVHRDIKPENILVDREGRVKIADFGLAKLLQRTPVELNITRTGQVMGTLHYMAPEQYKAPEGVDHRADIYSLGVVFYEMLTGELPVGSFPRPSSRAGVDARLDGVVLRAMERERDQRYQKASEVRTAVDGITSAPGAPPTTVASAAATAPAPEAGPVLNRWALYGALGIPASIAAGVVGWMLVAPFASSHAAFWTGALFTTIVALGGWISSFVGWAQVHHDRKRWSGLGWAITGACLPLVLFCSGGFMVPLFLVTGNATRGPISIHEGDDGTRVDLPGISVEDGPGGTKVRLPGISVEEKKGSSWMDSVPEVEGGTLGMDVGGRLRIRKSLDRAWDDLVEVMDRPSESRCRSLLAPSERETYDRMTEAEKSRETIGFGLGAAFLPWTSGAFTGSDPKEMRLVRVILGADQTKARVVRTDGKMIFTYPAVEEDGRWRFALGKVDRVFVRGGPASASPKWKADAVRGLERHWVEVGAGLLASRFPATDLPDRVSMFRLDSLALRRNGTSGRMVWTDGGTTVSFPCRYAEGKWDVPGGPFQRLDRAPLPEDRDGWLGEAPEPVEGGEAAGIPVQGGPADLAPEARARIAREIADLWDTTGPTMFGRNFPMFVGRDKSVDFRLPGSATDYRLYAVALSEDGSSGRAVLTSATDALSVSLHRSGEAWTLGETDWEWRVGKAAAGDEDGWLFR